MMAELTSDQWQRMDYRIITNNPDASNATQVKRGIIGLPQKGLDTAIQR